MTSFGDVFYIKEELYMLKLNMPTVETERLILRNIEEGDAEDMYEYASDDETIFWLSFPKHRSIEDSRQVIRDLFMTRVEHGNPSGYCLVLKENNKMIGCCDIAEVDRFGSGNIGYVINKEYWNQGYATEACLKLIEVAFEYVGFHRLEIAHAVGNLRSKKVIEKCGFVFEGIKRKYVPIHDGTYHDCMIYSLLKEDYERMKENGKRTDQ